MNNFQWNGKIQIVLLDLDLKCQGQTFGILFSLRILVSQGTMQAG